MYPKFFGGVVAFTPAQYEEVNGFSNLFFGWGSEDDNLRGRVMTIFKNFIQFRPRTVGRSVYTQL